MSQIRAGRDEACCQSVSRMAELGRYGEEFTFYGCVLWQGERRRYYLSQRAEALYACRRQWLLEGRIVSPIETASQRLMIPSGSRESLKQKVRLDLAKTLQAHYPAQLFQTLAPYNALPANNTAYPLLLELQKTWSGQFDADHLQLFANLTEDAYLRKRLTTQSYTELCRWQRRLQNQLGLYDGPLEAERRTFSAYLYADGPAPKLAMGLPAYKVLRQKEQHDLSGQLTTPIFSKTASFSDITHLHNARQTFARQAQAYLEGCWPINQRLRTLPAVLTNTDFTEQTQPLASNLPPAAAQTLQWYGLLWG